MSPFAVKAIQLLLSLSLLIVLHELGHFIPAKLFKTRVEKFYLFFDVKYSLFKKKIGETVYGIGWLPLGGYVKISGMIDESMDKEQMALPPQPWEFRSKPAWQRLIIMLGGVTVNIIVGMIIYICIFYFVGQKIVTNEQLPNGFEVSQTFKELGFKNGDQVLKLNEEEFENLNDLNRFLFLREVNSLTVKHSDGNMETLSVPEDIGMTMFKAGELQPFQPVRSTVLDTIIENLPAQKVGLLKGDRVLSINGIEITNWADMSDLVKKNPGNEIVIQVARAGAVETFNLTPTENGTIGINNFGTEYLNAYKEVKYSFFESL